MITVIRTKRGRALQHSTGGAVSVWFPLLLWDQPVSVSVWGMEQQQPLPPAGTRGCKDRQPPLTADIVQANS